MECLVYYDYKRVPLCGIYKITCKKNGKVYIGQSNDIEARWCNHKCELENNKHHNIHLQRAWRKYGEDSFVWEIIEECEESLLDDREIFYISEYDSYKQGYNQTTGGEGNRGWKPSEETKRKISEAHKGEKNPMYGKHLSKEHRRKIGEANKGENNFNFGKHLSEETRRKISEANKNPSEEIRRKISEATRNPSEETRQKMSEAHKGKNCGEKNPRSSKVICIETGIIYSTITEASRELNLNQSNISAVCRGKRKSCGGYHWQYVQE